MNAPKLRFKEFNDEWDYKTFDELINIKSESYNPSLNKENYKCIELEHINQNTGTINGYCNSQDQKSNKNIFKKNEVLFGKLRPYLKKYWYATFDGVCSSEIWVGKSKNQNIVTNKFIYDLFQSHYFLQLCNLSTGSKMPRADWSFIKDQSIAIPNILEQKKISDTLELLDKKIELQTKKIEDLKLFKLRINNGMFNRYKTIKLKDICECKSSTINLSDIDNDNGIYPIYGANGEIKKISSYQNEKDYLAIVKDGAGVGRTIICNKKSSIIATLSALIPNDMPVYYFNELISKINFSKYIVGSGIPHIYFKDYSNEKLCLHEEKERVLINNLFKILIIKIELEVKELHKLQELKKGLMQQMFV